MRIPARSNTRNRTPKIFHHDLSTSLLLISKLSKGPLSSIMITGTTRENIIATIIPGMMKQMTPRIIKMPETRPATRRDASLWIARSNALARFASPFSKRSEAYFTTIPFAIVLMIQKETHKTDVDAMKGPR